MREPAAEAAGHRVPKIAIDLTPLRPGGENGGAKWLAWELLEGFRRLAPDTFNFLLLTASWNDAELAYFDGPGFSRLCVLQGEPDTPSQVRQSWIGKTLFQVRQRLPYSLVRRVLPAARRLKRMTRQAPVPDLNASRVLSQHGVDLLFCPFAAVTYSEPHIPTVCILHDLQTRVYPQFFSSERVAEWERVFAGLRRRADVVVCSSDFTRRTLLAEFPDIPHNNTTVLPVSIHTRFDLNSTAEVDGLPDHDFFFYPANYWPHKNHKMLLVAFSMLHHRRPDLALDLVFTGASNTAEQELREVAKIMGLAGRVYFLGILTEDQLATVYRRCRAVVYPTLFEGFGIPLLEAFYFDRPVLCSDRASLPEVGGDAVLTFDPRQPAALLKALEHFLDQPDLAATMIAAGRRRLEHFRPERLLSQYEALFQRLLTRQAKRQTNELWGGFEDGWLGPRVEIYYASADAARTLEMELVVPGWLPHPTLTIQWQNGMEKPGQMTVDSGQQLVLSMPLSSSSGSVVMQIQPGFQPNAHLSGSDDSRQLACMCTRCAILGEDGKVITLFPNES